MVTYAAEPPDALIGAILNTSGMGLFAGAVYLLLRDHLNRIVVQADTITQRFCAELAADRQQREASARELLTAVHGDHQVCRTEHCAVVQRLDAIEKRQSEIQVLLRRKGKEEGDES